jgi:hypothetical protein
MIRPQELVIGGLDPAIYEDRAIAEAHYGLPGPRAFGAARQ